MYKSFKLRVGLWVSVLAVSIVALTGALYLGKIYLEIIREGSTPKSTKVSTGNTKSVVAREEQLAMMLDPIPVYYLQAGVFTDVYGAEQAAKPIREMGYIPYITKSTPFKIWIGVYQKRADTEYIKQQLRDKGCGSFTAATVVNGSNLRYGKGNEAFIREMTPVMEGYTTWLRESLPFFHAASVDRLDLALLEKQYAVMEKVYKNATAVSKGVVSNNDGINGGLKGLCDTAAGYHSQLEKFRYQRNQSNYAALQYRLLEFIDNYLLLWQTIDNISKT